MRTCTVACTKAATRMAVERMGDKGCQEYVVDGQQDDEQKKEEDHIE
jgi:hypothetical protein